METAYVKKSTDNSVAQTKKKCELSEADLKQQIEVCCQSLNQNQDLIQYFYY